MDDELYQSLAKGGFGTWKYLHVHKNPTWAPTCATRDFVFQGFWGFNIERERKWYWSCRKIYWNKCSLYTGSHVAYVKHLYWPWHMHRSEEVILYLRTWRHTKWSWACNDVSPSSWECLTLDRSLFHPHQTTGHEGQPVGVANVWGEVREQR